MDLKIVALTIALIGAFFVGATAAGPDDPVSEIVRTKKLVVVDDQGRDFLVVGTDEFGPRLKVLHPNGKTAATVILSAGGTGLFMWDPNETLGVQLATDGDGGSLDLFGPDSGPVGFKQLYHAP